MSLLSNEKMFEYFLMFFGINLKNKFLAHFLTGLTFSVFSLLFIRYFIKFTNNDGFNSLFIDLMPMMFFFSELLSFLLIKIKSEKILELNSKMKNYRKLNFVKKHNINKPLIIAIVVWIISTIFLHHVINIKIEKLMITFGISSSNKLFLKIITTLYSHFWKLLLHLIYHELNNRYSDIVEDFALEMERKLTFPDINAIEVTHRIIIQFIDFQTSLKESVGFIKPFMLTYST